MQNIVLIIHLVLALSLIAVVLLQRSSDGAMGLGGAALGPQAGRPPLTGLAKATWGLAIAFICTSIALTVISAANDADSSVVDRVVLPADAPATTTPALPDLQLPALPGANTPLLPPASGN
ncbi:MAG: preprotein translocase subunit SecG [Paracoccaceae bacterium]